MPQTARVFRRRAPLAPVIIACLAALTTLVACSSSTSGPSATPEKGVGGSVPVSAPAGSSSSVASSSAADSSTAASSSGASGDFTGATFTTPSGFQPSNSFSPAVPLEAAYRSYFLVPTSAPTGGSVIGIYIYTLPADKAVTATTDIPARITAYNTKLKATVTNPVSTFSTPNLAGYRDYKEGITQPPNFTYLAYFSFGAHHVMEFTCQYTDAASLGSFATSCGTVLGSVKLS